MDEIIDKDAERVDERTRRLVGKLVQIILEDTKTGKSFFYHGYLVDYSKHDIIIDDAKNGEITFSRNRKYLVRPMSAEQKLKLMTKLSDVGSRGKMLGLDERIHEFWKKNREDWNKLFPHFKIEDRKDSENSEK